MPPLESHSLVRITRSVIADVNGMAVSLPAGDYRAERLAVGDESAHDQYLLVPISRARAHGISGEILKMLMGSNCIKVLAEG
ncbi:MAG: hypothetical protein H6851_09095 [Geminicoccaceae bacterium]|nr:hypothetical protein [Geminicoccaceae bacterium]MCB9943759.1 hypothetical protein [Geminicoccaceae bacterium]